MTTRLAGLIVVPVATEAALESTPEEHNMAPFTAFHTHTETAALRDALLALDVAADLYQDGTSGGLLCVIVPLVEGDSESAEYRDHLLISTEGEAVSEALGGTKWFGGLYLVQGETYPEWVDDVTIDVPQRTWLGETEADVARSLLPLLRRLGAQQTD